jgi:hypothetical protein
MFWNSSKTTDNIMEHNLVACTDVYKCMKATYVHMVRENKMYTPGQCGSSEA